MNYIFAASGAIICIFILLILNKKEKNRADFLLIAINLIIGCFLLSDVLVNWKLSSATVILQNGLPLLLFPIFVLYLLQFTHSKKGIKWHWYLFFVPFILFLFLSFIDHYLLNNYSTLSDIKQHFNAPSIWYQLIFKGTQLLFIVILIRLLKALNQFEQEIKNGYSSIETIDIQWLRNFTWIYLFSISITFLLFLAQNIGLLPFSINQVFGIVYGILVCSVFYMNYHGIRHYTLTQFDKLHSLGEQPNVDVATIEKNIPSSANELNDEEQIIEQRLLAMIEEEKLYLEPKISLRELAHKVNRSTHVVSKIINAKANRSFYDLINGYRVDHLKGLLDDPKNAHFTILSLGFESGFNSKASLNRIFKNKTGMTPKQYLIQKSQSIG